MPSQHATCSKSGKAPSRRAKGRYDKCLDEGWIKGGATPEPGSLHQVAAAGGDLAVGLM